MKTSTLVLVVLLLAALMLLAGAANAADFVEVWADDATYVHDCAVLEVTEGTGGGALRMECPPTAPALDAPHAGPAPAGSGSWSVLAHDAGVFTAPAPRDWGWANCRLVAFHLVNGVHRYAFDCRALFWAGFE